MGPHFLIKMASVFVGNIPYGVTEDQLKDIFGEAGSVVSFRIVHDRETGRSKGFGFCEYQDPSSAAAAMRDLNGYEINGRTCELTVPTGNKKRLQSLFKRGSKKKKKKKKVFKSFLKGEKKKKKKKKK